MSTLNSAEQASKFQFLAPHFVEALISQNANIVFRTTAKNIGEKASQITPERPVLHGFNGKFSAVSNGRFRKFRLWPSLECQLITALILYAIETGSWTTVAIGRTRISEC